MSTCILSVISLAIIAFLKLPEKPMTGRFDNQKVGYFTNPLLSFSDAQQGTDKKQYIQWRDKIVLYRTEDSVRLRSQW